MLVPPNKIALFPYTTLVWARLNSPPLDPDTEIIHVPSFRSGFSFAPSYSKSPEVRTRDSFFFFPPSPFARILSRKTLYSAREVQFLPFFVMVENMVHCFPLPVSLTPGTSIMFFRALPFLPPSTSPSLASGPPLSSARMTPQRLFSASVEVDFSPVQWNQAFRTPTEGASFFSLFA